MTTQRKWPKISKAFTANGSTTGLVSIGNVAGFYLFQKVSVKSDLVAVLNDLQVIEILSDTTIRIGQFSKEHKRIVIDLSVYLTADNAIVFAPERKMTIVDYKTIIQEIFERFPVDAVRMIPVDAKGNLSKDTTVGNDTSATALATSTSYGQVNHIPSKVLVDALYSALQLNRTGGIWSTIQDSQTASPLLIAPTGAAQVAELIRLVGGNFVSSQPLLSHIWDIVLANGGTNVTTDGELILSTNTTANGSVIIESVRSARFITATYNISHQGVAIPSPDNTDVIRRWGAFNPAGSSINGIFFENNSGNISVVRLKNDVVAETVAESSFNGNNAFVKDGNVHIYEIIYNAGAINFMQDRKLIHRMSAASSAAFGTPHLKIGHKLENINGNIVNNELITRGSSISRIGSSSTIPEPFHITAAGTFFIKNSPGRLHRIIIGDRGVANSEITVFNSTTAADEVIAIIDSGDVAGSLDYAGLEFDIGLTILVDGANVDVTIVYD